MKVKTAQSENDDSLIVEENVTVSESFTTSEEKPVETKTDEIDETEYESDFIDEKETDNSSTFNYDAGDMKSFSKLSDKKIPVKSKFPKNATSIECIITATGYRDRVIASGKELRLLQARLYLIPVDTDINSDDFNCIKVMSDMSDSIDVRYIKDGFACVSALKHNVKIKDNVRLAILS